MDDLDLLLLCEESDLHEELLLLALLGDERRATFIFNIDPRISSEVETVRTVQGCSADGTTVQPINVTCARGR